MSERTYQARKRRRRRKQQISPVLIVLPLIVVALAAVAISFYMERYVPTTERMDLSEAIAVEAGEVALFVDQVELEEKGQSRDGATYVDQATAEGYLNDRFYYNSDGDLRYMMPTEIVKIMPGDTGVTVGGAYTELGHKAFFVEEDKVWLSLKLLEMFSNWKVELYEAPSRAFITTQFEGRQTAVAKEDTEIRYRGGVKSPILADLAGGETVYVLADYEDWLEVSYQGVIGYVPTERLSEVQTFDEEAPDREPVFSSIRHEQDICLAWHQMFSAGGNADLANFLEGTAGITVLSPTWYSLSDNEGNFTSLASADYVTEAHARGIEVWGLIDDFSSEIDLYTILSNCASREALVNNLMAAAAEVGLDGINIDFEYVTAECGEHFVQFYRELSVECRKAGLVLSVDNFVPSGGRAYVNREEQGRVLDYVIVMSYDEHYSGGSSAGSTASLPFSRDGIVDTIADGVPAEKVINGVPFFTRIWKEVPEAQAAAGAQIIQDPNSTYGRYALESSAAGMAAAASQLAEHGVTPVWLEEEQQYYGDYEEEGCLVRIWLEDVTSIEAKMQVIAEQEIAGAAFWKLGLEDTAVWGVIANYLN